MPYDTPGRGRSFHLEIHSLEEFTAFVAIIRGESFDLAKLRELQARLAESTADLDDAVKDASADT